MNYFFFVSFLIFFFTKTLAETSKGFSIPFEYINGSYVADVSVGSNADNVSLQIFADSATSVVLASDVECRHDSYEVIPELFKDSCKRMGTFDVDASTTAVHIRDIDTIQMLIVASGELVQDSFALGGEWVDNLPLYVLNKTELQSGLLALGLGNDSIVTAMKRQGVIDKAIFSMSSDSVEGYLEFGTYDDSYDLKTFPVYDETFMVPMESIEVDNNSFDTKFNASLDVMTYASTFPSHVLDEIFKNLNETLDIDNVYGVRQFPCQQTDIELKFNLDGLSLNVPLDNVVKETLDGNCTLTFRLGVIDFMIFSQDILSHAYVVFDLEEEKVSIAARDFTNSSSSSGSSSGSTSWSTSGSSIESSIESSTESNESTQSDSESTKSESSNESSDSSESSTSTSTSSSNPSSKLIPSSFLILISILLSL